jgi:hypothetical protein
LADGDFVELLADKTDIAEVSRPVYLSNRVSKLVYKAATRSCSKSVLLAALFKPMCDHRT